MATRRSERVTITGDVAELRRQRSRFGAVISGAHVPIWVPSDGIPADTFDVASPDVTAYQLTYLPRGLNGVYLNGLLLRDGTDYTLDYSSGLLTMTAVLTLDDVIEVHYVTTGALQAGTAAPDVGDLVTIVDFDATGWKYKQVPLADTTDYSATSYDDSAWSTGQAAFGSGTGPTAKNTTWTLDTSMWLRRTIAAVKALRITVRIDNNATLWVNGTQVADGSTLQGADNGTLTPSPIDVDAALLDDVGSNYIAIRADDDAASGSGDVCFVDMRIEGVLA